MNIGQFTTFQTEAFAENFFSFDHKDQIESLQKKIADAEKFFVVGSGSNILLSQKKYGPEILFIKNNVKGYDYLGNGNRRISSGENLSLFTMDLNKEYHVNSINEFFGLPGTVGGAVVGNSGSFGLEMGAYVKGGDLIGEDGRMINFVSTGSNENNRDIIYKYSYRRSSLKEIKNFLIDVEMEFPMTWVDEKKDPKRYMDWRLQHQEYYKSCGSTFKNYSSQYEKINSVTMEKILTVSGNPIEKQLQEKKSLLTVSAGRLIEHTELKGYDLGGVKVSEKHANFISNYANKDPEKIMQLIHEIKEKVFEKFGVLLEEEVVIL